MLLHIGADQSVPLDKLLFVLNARGMTPQADEYVKRAKKERRYMPCGHGAVKSYIVSVEHGREVVHGTNIASPTLEKRWKQTISLADLDEVAALIVEGTERK